MEVLSEIFFEKFGFRLVEPQSHKVVNVTVKPFIQLTIKERDPTKTKSRALSTIIERKASINNLL